MIKKLLLAALLALVPATAQAQALTPACSRPPPSFGVVWTAAQWTACLSSFQAFLGYVPLNAAGGVMSGELFLPQSTTANAPINFPPGTAPTTPSNGDVWFQSNGLYYRQTGVTVGPLVSSATVGLTVGTTPISSGTSGYIEYDNAGILGELATTGSGNVVRATAPTITTLTVSSGGAAVTGDSSVAGGFTVSGTKSISVTATAGGWNANAFNLYGGTAPALYSSGPDNSTFNAGGWTIGRAHADGSGAVSDFSSTQAGNLTIGTTGHTVTAPAEIITVASATGTAGLNVPHGTAPTSPVNGDTWTTTAGIFVRINGATVGPLLSSASLPPAVVWSDTPITSNTAVTANSGSCVNTSGGAVSITIPTTPTAGTLVELDDCNQSFGTHAMTVIPGGSDKIMGVAANLLDNMRNFSILLRYNAAQTNWLLIP